MSAFPYGFIILAAGESSRLGEPKALLPYRGQTLLEHAIRAIADFDGAQWLVVTGAHHDAIRAALPEYENRMVYNPNWKRGLSSSIRMGLNALQEELPVSRGAFLIVCDQPFITTELLRYMIGQKEHTQKSIVACAYGGTLGTPALFGPGHYAALMALDGDKGAKSLIFERETEVCSVPFTQGEIDIDTKEDYTRLLALL